MCVHRDRLVRAMTPPSPHISGARNKKSLGVFPRITCPRWIGCGPRSDTDALSSHSLARTSDVTPHPKGSPACTQRAGSQKPRADAQTPAGLRAPAMSASFSLPSQTEEVRSRPESKDGAGSQLSFCYFPGSAPCLVLVWFVFVCF